MDSAEDGYEDERFESTVPDNLHCVICSNVLRQPMQCATNEHFFCQRCITCHLQESDTCPTCIEPLTIQTLRRSRFVRDLVSQLNIRCDNVHRGCAEVVTVETLEAHVATCEFSPVECSNNGCEMMVNRKDQAHHETNECNFRQGKCEVCGKDVAYARRTLHCYVTRREVEEIKRSVRETIKDEMDGMKEMMMNMSRHDTSNLCDVKEQMDQLKKMMEEHMRNMNTRMNGLKSEVDDITKKEQCTKESQSQASAIDSFVTRSDETSNMKEDIIIAGGWESVKSVEIFSWTTRQWTHLPPMTSERYLSSSFVHRDQMFICGGESEFSKDSMEVLKLNIDGALWMIVPAKLPQGTLGHTSVVYEDNLFIFGGESSGKVVDTIYRVSLVSPSSSQLACHMPEPRVSHGAQLFGDKVVIVGGSTTGDSSGPMDTVFVYDITNNCCQTLAPLPFPVRKMATVAWNGNIIIMGGENKDGNMLNTVVSYSISNQKSEMLPLMKCKRSGCAAVITDNVIVVMGGCDAGNHVECYNFDLGLWKELPSMNDARYKATAVVHKCCK